MGTFFKWICVCLFGLWLLGLAVEGTKTPEQRAADLRAKDEERQRQASKQQQHANDEEASLPSYTASQLSNAYEENSVAADQIFKGKKFRVSGVVDNINTDIFGNPYLVLRGGVNRFLGPQFSFDESAATRLANIKKGMRVDLICVGKGDVAKTPMSGDCVLL